MQIPGLKNKLLESPAFRTDEAFNFFFSCAFYVKRWHCLTVSPVDQQCDIFFSMSENKLLWE
jgi:hypothetical protein